MTRNKRFFVNVLTSVFLLLAAAGTLSAQTQERFGLTPAQFQSAFDEFFKQGYRLKSVTGYVNGGSERYAALWVKAGGPAWQARFGLSPADYQKTFDELGKQGYRLTWVSAHEANGQVRYEGIWEKTSGPAWVARNGMNGSQYQQAFDSYKKQGFRLIHVYGYSVSGSAQYAAIWEKSNGPAYEARNGLSSSQFQTTFNDLTGKGYVLKVMSGYNVGGHDEYAAIFEKTSSPYWMARFGLPDTLYQDVFDNYYYQGYLPVFVTAFTSGNEARINTIWTNTNFKAGDLNTIQGAMDEALKATKITGLSIAVGKNGRLVYAAGFGSADKENGIDMSVDHRLRIGSISKTVTSVAIFRLIEAHAKFGNGKTLTLDSPVFGPEGVLSDISLPALMAPLKDAKIHHLLEHTSGIPGNAGDPIHCSSGNLDKRIEYQLAQIQAIPANSTTAKGPVPRPVGTKFDYSNLNFNILQSVIQTVSGQSYEDYVREHVFAASHMTAPRLFKIGPYDPSSGEAKHYLANGGYAEYSSSGTCDNQPPGTGAGGWAMSAKDLLRHLASVDGFQPGDILSQDDRTTMLTASSVWPNPPNGAQEYGKGWQLDNWGSCNSAWTLVQGHNGGLAGAFSDLFLLPNGMSFALIANQDPTPNGFCTPIATSMTPKPAKVACGGTGQPTCADEPLSRLIEILNKVTWPDYNLF